jgi:hypothetical protein
VGKRCCGKAVVWWINLRSKGIRNSLNGALYSGGSLGRGEPAAEARIGGRSGRLLGRGAVRRCTRARGRVGWAGKWA